MKSVDRDAYYDLQEIFSCMFYVIELGITLDFPDLTQESYAGGVIQMLPSHLYDSQNKKNYWLGLFIRVSSKSSFYDACSFLLLNLYNFRYFGLLLSS